MLNHRDVRCVVDCCGFFVEFVNLGCAKEVSTWK